jgi:NAD(P)-dependent dehydrogenase (short-subunit alcohol dehydrogenase family)
MRVLALRGAHVLGTGRTLAKAREACAGMPGKTSPLALELTDFESVVACAREVERLGMSLDMLVCNAGIVLGTLEQVHGLEKQFVVNHLGHYLLVRRLLPCVLAAPQGRVVVLGSGDHRNAPEGGIQFGQLSGEGWQGRGYAHSKLANGLFSLELAHRLKGTRATSNCVSPGHVRSNILRNTGNAYRANARSVQQGAATPCYVAAHPAMAGLSGGFFRDFARAKQSAHQQDAAMAARLWQVSETLVRPWLADA